MADTFVECLVKRVKPAYADFLKYGLILLTITCFLLGIMNFLFFIPMVILIVVSCIVIPGLNIEYEYAFIGDQINVDKIINMAKRKKITIYEMERAELVAPENHSDILNFIQNPNNKSKVRDYTSRRADATVYGMIYNGKTERYLVYFEFTEKMVRALRAQSPRKVILGEFPKTEENV